MMVHGKMEEFLRDAVRHLRPLPVAQGQIIRNKPGGRKTAEHGLFFDQQHSRTVAGRRERGSAAGDPAACHNDIRRVKDGRSSGSFHYRGCLLLHRILLRLCRLSAAIPL
jgi:hypothetical protein